MTKAASKMPLVVGQVNDSTKGKEKDRHLVKDDQETDSRKAIDDDTVLLDDDEVVDSEADDDEVNFLEENSTQTGSAIQIDDPIRIYLMQMGEMPLLDRHEEITAAKQIERARLDYRRSMLATDYVLQGAIDLLKKIRLAIETTRRRLPEERRRRAASYSRWVTTIVSIRRRRVARESSVIRIK